MAALYKFIGLIRSCWLRVRLTLQVLAEAFSTQITDDDGVGPSFVSHVGVVHARNGLNADKIVFFLFVFFELAKRCSVCHYETRQERRTSVVPKIQSCILLLYLNTFH